MSSFEILKEKAICLEALNMYGLLTSVFSQFFILYSNYIGLLGPAFFLQKNVFSSKLLKENVPNQNLKKVFNFNNDCNAFNPYYSVISAIAAQNTELSYFLVSRFLRSFNLNNKYYLRNIFLKTVKDFLYGMRQIKCSQTIILEFQVI